MCIYRQMFTRVFAYARRTAQKNSFGVHRETRECSLTSRSDRHDHRFSFPRATEGRLAEPQQHLFYTNPHLLTTPPPPPNKRQNLLRTEKIKNALAAKGMTQGGGGGGGGLGINNAFDNKDSRTTGFAGFGGLDHEGAGGDLSSLGGFGDDTGDFDDVSDDLDDLDLDDVDLDDGGYTDDNDLRRKLNRLAGPGGAMEAESRGAPHLFGPGGPLESPEMARAVGGGGGGSPGPAANGRKWLHLLLLAPLFGGTCFGGLPTERS